MLLMIDNYDSFTFNLVQYFGELGEDVRVSATTRSTSPASARCSPTGSCSRPARARRTRPASAWRRSTRFAGKLPILGVCLGHQAIGAAFGGKVVRAQRLMHGKSRRHQPRRPRRLRGAAAALLGDPLPLARDRAGEPARGARGHVDARATARSWACATASWRRRRRRSKACSSIPNRSSPSTAMRCSKNFLEADAMSTDMRRPAQRHRHAADAGDARRDGRGRGRRRRLRRRPERQRAAGADRGDARQGGRALRAERHAEQPRGAS